MSLVTSLLVLLRESPAKWLRTCRRNRFDVLHRTKAQRRKPLSVIVGPGVSLTACQSLLHSTSRHRGPIGDSCMPVSSTNTGPLDYIGMPSDDAPRASNKQQDYLPVPICHEKDHGVDNFV
jgi:hypothetical protein